MKFFEVFLRGGKGSFLGHFIDKKLDGWEVGGTSGTSRTGCLGVDNHVEHVEHVEGSGGLGDGR